MVLALQDSTGIVCISVNHAVIPKVYDSYIHKPIHKCTLEQLKLLTVTWIVQVLCVSPSEIVKASLAQREEVCDYVVAVNL